MNDMIELALFATTAAVAGWLIRRKQQQRSDRITTEGPTEIACMLKRQGRWRPGKLSIGTDSLVWEQALSKQMVKLLTDLRCVEFRRPTAREMLAINPGSRVVECKSLQGNLLIAVMPDDLAHALRLMGK
ncbi:DUF2550 family protein [Streptomyces californicus]|uniref:DUF2550 family protein n=1 Tax=Streptomyces californicus TaxID=67351 RepID=UPI0012FF430C|nr:DUF2550 family protein [Streptomyces californicus]QRV56253.1 DUF2550 family protein [Streptomyces californicus]